MAGRIRDEDIALVRERARIDEVVGEHVQLRNAGGGSLKGLCPFHEEKSPSFHVTPARGLYYCFGCGAGGDVIGFVQQVEHLTFAEAVERLGAPRTESGERACWLAPGGSGVALYAHGRTADQPIRSLALSAATDEASRSCAESQALTPPVALEAGLRIGMAAAEVEQILGPVTVDAAGAFGKECCGLEQTGEGERGPVYEFGCSAVLGAFKDGKLASLLVSRYEPPASSVDR